MTISQLRSLNDAKKRGVTAEQAQEPEEEIEICSDVVFDAAAESHEYESADMAGIHSPPTVHHGY